MIAAALLLALPGAASSQRFEGANQAPIDDEIPVALLVDLSTGQRLFERETDRRFVPASVTKVMTAYTAFKLIEAGELDPAMRFQISEEIDEKWSGEGSTMFLKAGEQPTVGQLLMGVTTVSGNDASVALAIAAVGSEAAWLEQMNRNAADLGMRDTHFGGANGFPDGGTTYTTADDLALLGEALVTRYPGLYRRYFGKRRLTWRNITQINHDPVTGRVVGGDGIKTGYTGEAGYTVVGSAERGGRRLLVVIGGSPTGSARDKSARDLLNWGFEHFQRRELLPAHTIVGHAAVQNGAADSVKLRIADDLFVSAPRGQSTTMTTQIRYRGPIMAPIAEGAQVATLRITYPGEVSHEIPLEAAESVPQAGLFRRLGHGLAALFT